MAQPRLTKLLDGIAFGESPRWHEGRLWFADWGTQEIVAVDLDGKAEAIVKVDFPSFPMCFDWLPDGRLLIVSGRDGRLLRRDGRGASGPAGLLERRQLWRFRPPERRGSRS